MIDLDALKARREALGINPQFTLAKQKFNLPVELPFRCLELMEEEKIVPFVKELLGEKQYEKFAALGPTLTDVMVLANELANEYVVSATNVAEGGISNEDSEDGSASKALKGNRKASKS